VGPGSEPTPKALPVARPERRRALLSTGEHGYRELRGANLSGARLVRKNFEGADLTGATFEGASFEGVLFSHADLTGATLPTGKGALDGAFFGGARCPDATLADDHGGTCAGHLEPVATPGITPDAAPVPGSREAAWGELLEALEER